MHFDLVDRVLEQSDSRIVTLKLVSGAEEYLQDHFPTFPVLPGVLMLESLVQAARVLLKGRSPNLSRLVLGNVRALKYGAFVRPGAALRAEVELLKQLDGGGFDCRGSGLLIEPGVTSDWPVAVSGRFVLRPIRVASTRPAHAESSNA